MKNNSLLILLAALVLTSAGCATVPGKGDPRDPFESYNRGMYKFNDTVDRAFLKPVAQGYDFIVPDPVKTGIRNFFSNLGEVVILVNDALQGKGQQALSDTGRFIINSTFGLVGILDIATPAGLPKNNEDFGQTLGKWGVNSGPFLVLPFLGPSTVRDAVARPVDFQLQYFKYVDNIRVRNSAYALEVIDTRASLLRASNILGEAALDPYIFFRDAWLQRRERLVYDGNPPKSKDDLDEEEPDASGVKPDGQKSDDKKPGESKPEEKKSEQK